MNKKDQKLADELDDGINNDTIQFVDDEFIDDDSYIREYEDKKTGTRYFETYTRTHVEREEE